MDEDNPKLCTETWLPNVMVSVTTAVGTADNTLYLMVQTVSDDLSYRALTTTHSRSQSMRREWTTIENEYFRFSDKFHHVYNCGSFN